MIPNLSWRTCANVPWSTLLAVGETGVLISMGLGSAFGAAAAIEIGDEPDARRSRLRNDQEEAQWRLIPYAA
jgi:hypothetical protein